MRFAIVMSLALVGCGAPPAASDAPPLERGQVVLDGVTAHRFAQDEVAHRARVSRITFTRGEDQVVGTGVEARLRGPEGAATEISAPKAIWSTEDQTTRLSGGVRIRDADGRVLETDRLRHDGATDRLHSDAPVVLRGENFEARGQGLEGRVSERLTLQGPVEATFTPSEDSR